jgi:biopolymer transport protein ExbB/TolQ
MKDNPSFIFRRWTQMDLQARLFLVFTILFLFSVLILSLFLFNNLRMVAINNRARAVFEQNRQVYRLYTMVQQYEVALNNYELNANQLAKIELEIQSSQIDEAVNALRPALVMTSWTISTSLLSTNSS